MDKFRAWSRSEPRFIFEYTFRANTVQYWRAGSAGHYSVANRPQYKDRAKVEQMLAIAKAQAKHQ
jgi:hypothetical protein